MIENLDSTIKDLNLRLRAVIGTDFTLDPISTQGMLCVFQSHGNDIALNRLGDGTSGEVPVYNWFGEYYIFMEIKVIYKPTRHKGKKSANRDTAQISVSISFFKRISENITQIFRAEWDDYNESTYEHPQPHWHFTADTAISRSFEEYAKQFGEEGFMAILEPKKEDISELKEIHFAMNGQWAKQLSHMHKIESGSDLINWIGGVLDTIRKEIGYASVP